MGRYVSKSVGGSPATPLDWKAIHRNLKRAEMASNRRRRGVGVFNRSRPPGRKLLDRHNTDGFERSSHDPSTPSTRKQRTPATFPRTQAEQDVLAMEKPNYKADTKDVFKLMTKNVDNIDREMGKDTRIISKENVDTTSIPMLSSDIESNGTVEKHASLRFLDTDVAEGHNQTRSSLLNPPRSLELSKNPLRSTATDESNKRSLPPQKLMQKLDIGKDILAKNNYNDGCTYTGVSNDESDQAVHRNASPSQMAEANKIKTRLHDALLVRRETTSDETAPLPEREKSYSSRPYLPSELRPIELNKAVWMEFIQDKPQQTAGKSSVQRGRRFIPKALPEDGTRSLSPLKSPKRWLRRNSSGAQYLPPGFVASGVTDDLYYRETAFELSVTLCIAASLTANSRVQIKYHAKLNTVLAGDNSADLFAFPIVISNGLAEDQKFILKPGENTIKLTNDFPPSGYPMDEKEHKSTVTIIRHADDLETPVEAFMELSYPLLEADRGKYLVVAIPNFRPRTGYVRETRVFMSEPRIPLMMKAKERGTNHDFNISQPIAGVTLFERGPGSPLKAEGICLNFHRWPTAIFHPTNTPGGLDANAKVSWDGKIEILQLPSTILVCRMSLSVTVGTDDVLLSMSPCGWAASYFLVDGRCVSHPCSQYNSPSADSHGTCLEDDEGRYVILRQPTMKIGSVVKIDMCWLESAGIGLRLEQRDKRTGERQYNIRLPRVASHHFIGGKFKNSLHDYIFLSTVDMVDLLKSKIIAAGSTTVLPPLQKEEAIWIRLACSFRGSGIPYSGDSTISDDESEKDANIQQDCSSGAQDETSDWEDSDGGEEEDVEPVHVPAAFRNVSKSTKRVDGIPIKNFRPNVRKRRYLREVQEEEEDEEEMSGSTLGRKLLFGALAIVIAINVWQNFGSDLTNLAIGRYGIAIGPGDDSEEARVEAGNAFESARIPTEENLKSIQIEQVESNDDKVGVVKAQDTADSKGEKQNATVSLEQHNVRDIVDRLLGWRG